MIPKFTSFALRRMLPVTSSAATLKTFIAVAVWMSKFSLNALTSASSPQMWAMILSSIWE